MVTLPYVAFLSSAAAVVIVGTLEPSLVTRKTFYCVVDKDPLTMFLGAYSAVCCVTSIILEGEKLPRLCLFTPNQIMPPIVCIAVTLRRHRHQVIESGMDASLVLRVVTFGLFILLGLMYVCIRWSPSTIIDPAVQSLCPFNPGLVECNPGPLLLDIRPRHFLRLWEPKGYPATLETLVPPLHSPARTTDTGHGDPATNQLRLC